jgi:hypothetical protein
MKGVWGPVKEVVNCVDYHDQSSYQDNVYNKLLL